MLGRSSQTAEVSMAQSGLADEKERSMQASQPTVLELLWICSSGFWACGFDSLGGVPCAHILEALRARVWSHLAPSNDDGASELLELLEAMSMT